MTALRAAQREIFAEELHDDLPWVPADQEDVADVIPIERPRLADVVRGLSQVMPLFDPEDLAELASDVAEVLENGSIRAAIQVIDEWRCTGESIRDANAREILGGDVTVDDFVDAPPFG